MDLLIDWQHSYQLNVILLSAVGLWPYGNKLVLKLKRFVAGYLALGSCACQLATFFTVDYSSQILVRNASGIFVGCAICHKYISILAASDNIKRATETINADFKQLDNKEEVEIVRKYVNRGKFHTKGFAMFICPAGISLLLFPLFTVFLDIVMPLNEARNRSFPIMFEPLFNQKKHFFLAVLFFDSCTVVAVLTFVATETLLIAYILHACALFEVTSYRIKKLLCDNGSRDSKESSDLLVIRYVVKSHSRAISGPQPLHFGISILGSRVPYYIYYYLARNSTEPPDEMYKLIFLKIEGHVGGFVAVKRHCKTITEDFLSPYIILLSLGILGLSAHLFHCTQTLPTREFLEFVTSGMFCFAILGYMFYFNFVVQHLIDLSGCIFDDLYNTNWYVFPTSTRKLVLFCMTNSIKPVTIDFCGLYIPSYEGFSLIARMAMSYATALYSFQ